MRTRTAGSKCCEEYPHLGRELSELLEEIVVDLCGRSSRPGGEASAGCGASLHGNRPGDGRSDGSASRDKCPGGSAHGELASKPLRDTSTRPDHLLEEADVLTRRTKQNCHRLDGFAEPSPLTPSHGLLKILPWLVLGLPTTLEGSWTRGPGTWVRRDDGNIFDSLRGVDETKVAFKGGSRKGQGGRRRRRDLTCRGRRV